MKRPKRFSMLATVVGALALCLGAAGCAGHKSCSMTEEQRAELQAKQEEGRRLASQVGCTKCGTPGCTGGAGCSGHREPPHKCPDPTVIKQPCETTGFIQVPGQQLNKLYGVNVSGTLVYQDYTADCDGSNVCKGEPKSIPFSAKTEIPLQAQIGPFSIPVTLQARPGEKPCPEKPDQPKP